jgi:hypothetical protein
MELRLTPFASPGSRVKGSGTRLDIAPSSRPELTRGSALAERTLKKLNR